jgi:N-sulfoglucosamine sulfohydrolase
VLTRERPIVANVAPVASRWLAQAPTDPWFMSVGFFETHREYPEPAASEDIRYTMPPPTVPDTPETRYDMAAYKASARIYDQGVGAVLAALQASGQAGNTLVINTTDHGIAFPGIKCNLTDHGIGVMLIMRGPGGFEGGRVIDALVSHIDIVPTICALADIQPPDWLQGRSMLPLLHGEVSSIRDEVHAEVTYHAAYEPMRCVRTTRWKYIRRYDGRETPVLPNCDDSPSKSVWLEHGWADRAVDAEQLYDLVYDPQETHNLAMFSTHNDVLDDMRSRLERWMQATDDPLLHGPVPAPRGAKVNDPDGTSPREDCIVIA